MYTDELSIFGLHVSVWDATFMVGVMLGYLLLRAAMRRRTSGRLPRLLLLRWLFTVYVATLGAQLFGYLFDLNTSALPPPGVPWVRYYFDPFIAAKTLYGAVVVLPVAVLAVSVPWRDLPYGQALDRWTPAIFAVLAVVRIGCFLEGCCYGIPSAWAGLSFAPESPVYYRQIELGVIEPGSWTRPVVPTQLIESVGLLAIAAVSFRTVAAGGTGVFLPAIAAYSAFRFGLEFLRDDPDRNVFGPLSTSQWIALLILGLYLVTRRLGRSP